MIRIAVPILWARGVAILLVGFLGTEAWAQDPPPTPAPSPARTSGVTHSLGECISLAMQNQPTLRAAQHSLNASQSGYEALLKLGKVAETLAPDLPVRREQARRGLAVAAADVEKAQHDITYDVTRMYYSFVYARQQEQTAIDVIEQMDTYYKVAREIVESGVRDPKMKLNQFTLYSLQNQIGDIRQLRVKAEVSRKNALAALKEAMGVDQSYDFTPRDTELPLMNGSVTKEQILELAQCRRPELVQVAASVDVYRLEICAQAKVKYNPRTQTFASGTDLHSRVVPQPIRDTEYKPGGITPEMPVGLAGKREDRIARATELSYRQDAVYEKTTNLVRLEAINAFLNWEAATRRVDEAKKKHESARRMLEESRAAAVARQDPELLVTNEGLAGRAQAEYVEAVFEHLKSLMALERVTAGGIRPAFPGR